MFDLLLGGPGETVETLHSVLRLMKDLNPTRVGLSVGVRVYPGTPLARLASHEPSALRPRMPQGTGPLNPPNLLRPQFYLSPALGDDLFGIVSDLVADDPRFLFADPTMQAQNYNYNANQVLIDAIAVGHRGAYWDILRRISATEANASSNQTKAS